MPNASLQSKKAAAFFQNWWGARMKSSWTKSTSLIIIGLAIFSHPEAWGEGLKLFSVGSNGIFRWHDSRLPEIRKNPKRVKKKSLMNWVESILDNGPDQKYSFR